MRYVEGVGIVWQTDYEIVAGPITSIFSPPKPATVVSAPPPPPPPAVMPTPDDAAVQAAKKNAIVAASQRSGRLSTILTDSSGNQAGSDKLGG